MLATHHHGGTLRSVLLTSALAFALVNPACSAGTGDLEPQGSGAMTAGGSGGSGALPPATGGGVHAGGAPPAAGGSGGSTPITGGSGGAGGTSPGTGGSTTTPYAGYDPNVRFVWQETTPQLGTCKPGEYAGTFAGMYFSGSFLGIPAVVPITGTVSLRLESAASGEFLDIRDGRVEGTADTPVGPVPFEADLVGELDCTNNRLINTYLRNGQYTIEGGSPTFFEGPLEADYDRIANQFVNGTWTVSEATPENPGNVYGGDGTWGAQWIAD
jgi:hypothetical protein